MLNDDVTQKSRNLAHWAAEVIGISVGVLLFGFGMRGLFSVGVNDTWLTVTAGISGTFTLLPLSVLGMFRPRLASYGVMGSWLVFLMSFFGSVHPGQMEFSASGVVWLLLCFFMLPSAIAGLLFYASGRDATLGASATAGDEFAGAGGQGRAPSTFRRWLTSLGNAVAAGGRRSQARWGAVILGLVAGAWHFPVGVSSVVRSIRMDDWLGVVGITATALTLLPLSILAIFKPRPAAYGALLNLALALAYPLVLFHPAQYGVSEVFGGVFWYSLLDFPLALVAGLLLYACSAQDRAA